MLGLIFLLRPLLRFAQPAAFAHKHFATRVAVAFGSPRLHIPAGTFFAATGEYTIPNAVAFPADSCDPRALNAPVQGQNAGLGLESDYGVGSPGVNGAIAGRVGTCQRTEFQNGVPVHVPYSCPTKSTGLLSFQPFVQNPSSWNPATIGWRRCPCLTPDDGRACEFACPRLASEFSASENWLKMRVEGADVNTKAVEPIGPAPSWNVDAFGQGSGPITPAAYVARWLWWVDSEVGAVPAIPSAGQINENVGNAMGRLWWFVPNLATGENATVFGVSAIRSSVFTGVQINELSGQPPDLSLRLRHKLAASDVICAECPEKTQLIDIQFGVDPAASIFAVSNVGFAVDLTSHFSLDARTALGAAGSSLLTAEEPLYRRARADVSHVVLTGDNAVAGIFTMSTRTGAVSSFGSGDGGPVIGPQGPVIGPQLKQAVSQTAVPHGRGFSVGLSGLRAELLGVGSPDGTAPASVIWKNDLRSNAWASVPIVSGPRPRHVFGVTMLASEGAYYVLDEDDCAGPRQRFDLQRGRDRDDDADGQDDHERRDNDCHALRLLRVDADRGMVQKVASWKKGDGQNFSITSSYGEELLISSSAHGRHSFVLLQLGDGKIAHASLADGRGEVAVFPRAMKQGIAWGEQNGSAVVSRTVEITDFRKIDVHRVASCF